MAIKPKVVKLSPRERKKQRLRKRVVGTNEKPRLCVFKSGRHTYAQLISDESGVTIVAASTLEPAVLERVGGLKAEELRTEARSPKSEAAARAVGVLIGERAKEKGIAQLVFDRNGFIYHGRVKAVAEGARQSGIRF